MLVIGCEAQPAQTVVTPAPSSPGGVGPPAALSCDFAVGSREVLVTAARRTQLGLTFWPDWTLGFERVDDRFVFYGAHGGSSDRKGIARLVGTLDDPAQTVTPRIGVKDEKSPVDYNTISSVHRDSKTGTLLAFSYTERLFPGGFYNGEGMLKSNDDGMTWTDLGPILSSVNPFDPNATHPYGATGAPVIVGDFFYLYFADNLPSGALSLGVARASIDDVVRAAIERGATVPWLKYHNGAWSEPGLGGRFSPLTVAKQWPARAVDGVPPGAVVPMSVSFNEYLKKYLMVVIQWPVSTRYGELHLLESSDGFTWENEQIIESDGDVDAYRGTTIGSRGAYGVMIGMGPDPRITGRDFYVYYTYFAVGGGDDWGDAVLARRQVSCAPTARAKTSLDLSTAVDLATEKTIATAKLTDAAGRPVGSAGLDLTWTPLDGAGTRNTYSATGIVPAGVTKAVVQLNYNQFSKLGPVDVDLYAARYGEAGATPRLIPNGDFAQGLSGWARSNDFVGNVARDPTGTPALHVGADASRSGSMNSGNFAVTPGATYTFAVDARVGAVSAGHGNVSLIFLETTEHSRKTIPFAAATTVVRGTTDGAGTYALRDLPRSVRVTVRYAGDAGHWPAPYVTESR